MREWDDETMVGFKEFMALTSTCGLGQIATLQQTDPTMPRPNIFPGDVFAFDRDEVSKWMSSRIDQGLEDFFGLPGPAR